MSTSLSCSDGATIVPPERSWAIMLLTRNTPEENEQRLHWALSRFAGYVGVTGALGSMRGERFANASYAFDPVLHELSARGLLYADPRPDAGKLPSVWQRRVDVIIDDQPDVDAADRREIGRAGPSRGRAGAARLVWWVRCDPRRSHASRPGPTNSRAVGACPGQRTRGCPARDGTDPVNDKPY